MSFLQHLIYTILTKLDFYFEGSYSQQVLLSAWTLFARLWPFVVIGILGTSLLSVLLPQGKIASLFRNRGAVSICVASTIGLICPFGAYSIIPLCAALLMASVPAAPVIAFLVATPLMNPNLFFITAGTLGYEIALLRALSSLVLGIMAGGITHVLISNSWLTRGRLDVNPPRQALKQFSSAKREKGGRPFPTAFPREVLSLSRFVGTYLFPSILLAAIISVFLPSTLIAKVLGSNSVLSVLFATGAGIPLYVCGGAAIPVVQELHYLGMSKGAVMAFFIAGPATKISTLVALKAVFRTPLFLIYVTITITGALVIGYLCNAFL